MELRRVPVKTIYQQAFHNKDKITSISIPNSITCIGDHAFEYCSSLTSVTIPDSVTSIGYGAFYGCDKLNAVYYAGSAGDWANISISDNNYCLTNANRYYYSGTVTT